MRHLGCYTDLPHSSQKASLKGTVRWEFAGENYDHGPNGGKRHVEMPQVGHADSCRPCPSALPQCKQLVDALVKGVGASLVTLIPRRQ